MRIPPPPQSYVPAYGREVARQVEQADRENVKRGQDYEVGEARVILTSPDGTRYALTVANDGTLGTSAV